MHGGSNKQLTNALEENQSTSYALTRIVKQSVPSVKRFLGEQREYLRPPVTDLATTKYESTLRRVQKAHTHNPERYGMGKRDM